MKTKLVLLFVIFTLFNISLSSNDCQKITVNPFEPTQIQISEENNKAKCVYFSYDNPIFGDVIIKFSKGNSYSSYIYIYEDESIISKNANSPDFVNYINKFQIGYDFFKEKKNN